ncbi:MAG: hypothetical protein ATN35_03600 [Epulopiscium sp. Nele67-Bin004]|nr:MAG: hypothetical protein ATN35_03600 [Epulopiscium sp. Nele67-Bin004]
MNKLKFLTLVLASIIFTGCEFPTEYETSTHFVPQQTPSVLSDIWTEIPVTVGADTTMPLEGVLTIPNDVQNPPVVLLVHGTGPNDKNSTIFENTPFLDIAHGLADLGIASLRYDKRTYAYPLKMLQYGTDLTLREEILDDVNSAIQFLLTQQDTVDTNKIFVLGHSQGGMLVPAIASENDTISGIISVAGTLRPLYEISYDQNHSLFENINNNPDLYGEDVVALVAEQMKQVEIDIEILRGDISDIPNDTVLMGLPAGYQKSVKQYQGLNFVDKINVPMLVLHGDADFQVTLPDFNLYERMLSGQVEATLIRYADLNHLMMESDYTKNITEYQTKGTVSREVIGDIAEWIFKN